MGDKKRFESAMEELFDEKHRFFSRAFRNRDHDTPYTFSVIGITCGVFLVEIYLTLDTAATSPEQIVAYLFIHETTVMWLIAPFVHQGWLHFGANVLGLYLMSPLEARLHRREFLILLVATGYIPVWADGIKIAIVSPKPNAAAYGISGLLFGLLGFAVVCFTGVYRRDGGLENRDWIIAAFAFSAVVTVLVDMGTAYPDPLAFNVGHFGGLVIGMVLGVVFRGWD